MRRGLLLALVLVLGLGSEARAEGPHPRCWQNNDGRVLSINDSHGVFGGDCRQYPSWDVDAWAGRTTAEGVDDLDARLRPRHAAVVYDLGSNDVLHPGITRPALREALAASGGRMLFLVTVTRNDSWPYEQVNEAIRDFASNHARVRALRWDLQVAPEDFPTDDPVHYTPEGYEKRVAFIESRVDPVLMKARKKKRR